MKWRCLLSPCRTAGEWMEPANAMTPGQAQHAHYMAEHYRPEVKR